MTSTEQDVQLVLLTPEQLLAEAQQMASTAKPCRYLYPVESHRPRASCTWEFQVPIGSPHEGVIEIGISAEQDMTTRRADWMKPDQITLKHRNYIGLDNTFIKFTVPEIHVIETGMRVPSTLTRLLGTLKIEDAVIE